MCGKRSVRFRSPHYKWRQRSKQSPRSSHPDFPKTKTEAGSSTGWSWRWVYLLHGFPTMRTPGQCSSIAVSLVRGRQKTYNPYQLTGWGRVWQFFFTWLNPIFLQITVKLMLFPVCLQSESWFLRCLVSTRSDVCSLPPLVGHNTIFHSSEMFLDAGSTLHSFPGGGGCSV